jgi:hypothetical protein
MNTCTWSRITTLFYVYGMCCLDPYAIMHPSTVASSITWMVIYLWSFVVCFVLYWWDPPDGDTSDCVLGLFGKALEEKGVSALVSWCLGFCSVEVLEYWMISSLKIKSNCSWKYRRIWIVPLVLLERSWWQGFNGIYLVRFGFRMWEILIFKRFLLLKIQINSKNSGFGRKNQLKMW